ncbi:MAG: hypothetical protein ACI4RA_08095 [Kiritimatiellia bacterium]
MAGWDELDFRASPPAADGWSMSGTTLNADRGLKFAEPGAFLTSPLYEGAVTSVTVVTYCSGTRIENPFIVSAGATEASFFDRGPYIGYVGNTYVTNEFVFGADESVHGVKIRLNAAGGVPGNYYVTSVAVKWRGGPLQPPREVRAENVETNAFVIYWRPPDDADWCRPLVWTNQVVGASPGEVVWREAFSNAPAKTGALPAIPSGWLEEYVDWPDEERYWVLDHVYPSVDAGSIRIGNTSTNGWLITPSLPGGEGLTLHLRARRQSSKDGSVMPVWRGSMDDVTELGCVTLTDDYRDYYLPVPVLEEEDYIMVYSTTNKRSSRVILDTLELLRGHEGGQVVPGYVVRGEATRETSWAVENLTPDEYFFAVEAVRGDARVVSSTGRVDLLERSPAALPPPVWLSELEGPVWREDFDRLADIFPGSGNETRWANVETLSPWQAWCDGVEPIRIKRNKGAVASGGLYAYWATNKLVSSYSLGWNVGSTAESFVIGAAFVNDQSAVLDEFSLAYVGRQFGFKNKEAQTIAVEWLVTNRLVSVWAEGDWRQEEALAFTTPAVGLGEELKSGEELPLEQRVAGTLEKAVLRPGEVLLVRWRRQRITYSAALAIDDVRLSFRKTKHSRATVLRIR